MRGKRSIRFAIVFTLAVGALFVSAQPAFAPCHVISFVGAPYGVDENKGKVTITITNNGGQQTGTWKAHYSTIDGTAKAGQDYKKTNGTIILLAGQDTGSFSIPIINDSKHEQSEDFAVAISNANGCPGFAFQYPSNATVIISDDDAAPTPSPTPATSSPTPKPTTKKPSSSPSATPTPTPTPTPSETALAVGKDSGGISGGALAGIVAAVVVLGGAAAFWVRKRYLT